MAKAKKAKNNKKYNLVIVESPAKAKTIEKFLGSKFKVAASNGHLVDLPKSRLGVAVEENFEPEYIVIRGRTPLLNELKKEAKKAEKIYLATDPDREGEAISWHIANAIEAAAKKDGVEKEIERVEFNEITKTAVTNAIKNPREIDMGRVDAQQARRVLDRLVGYKLSPLLWEKVRRGLSAGRVQSVTVKLIVDREREIRNFDPEEYWTITAALSDKEDNNTFTAEFFGKDKKKIVPKSEAEVKEILETIGKNDFVIAAIKKSVRQRKPYAPFTTSTLQQDAARKLGFTTRRTMMVAQGLYEGVQLSSRETVGLITYMRTDSTRISVEAQEAAKAYIIERYGKEYAPEKFNVYTGRRQAQDAHEAIRPTYIEYTPESIKDKLSAEQFRLYQLIYSRFIASQMTPARYDTMSYTLDAAGYEFRANFSKLQFSGYRAAYQEVVDEEEDINAIIPPMEEGYACKQQKIDPKQNFTSPPPRYTEASLVRTLEEKGIGRPSTYAPIISTILDRKYVKKEKRTIIPTELGEVVTELMEENFADIVNVEFTADMEEQLDKVEAREEDWKKVIDTFYWPFEEELKKAEAQIESVKLPDRPAGVTCELCGAEMVYKQGRFGEFIACPNYPECKNTKAIRNEISVPCPKCGGTILQKRSRRGSTFYGCENYPTCDFVSWDMPIEEKCETCGSYMTLKRGRGNSAYKKCPNEDCPTNQKKAKKSEEQSEG
ncbi:MAG: type I DNA topoisomerase [Christensenellaceae bacterium]|jgi:DNA topoisomerase-1